MHQSTIEQLRHDIDAGRTGDKVPYGDPAAAPLGTDEEAAGDPVPAAAIGLARSRELIGPAHAQTNGLGAAWVLVAVTLAFGGGLLIWVLA